jgi:hypothetical protein
MNSAISSKVVRGDEERQSSTHNLKLNKSLNCHKEIVFRKTVNFNSTFSLRHRSSHMKVR